MMIATIAMTVSIAGLQAKTQNRMTELLGSGGAGQGSGPRTERVAQTSSMTRAAGSGGATLEAPVQRSERLPLLSEPARDCWLPAFWPSGMRRPRTDGDQAASGLTGCIWLEMVQRRSNAEELS
jgi:hypothetical protein